MGRVQGWHNYYVQNPNVRPAPTWRQQHQLLTSHISDKSMLQTQLVAHQSAYVARRQDTPLRITKLDDQTLQRQVQHAERMRDLHHTRAKTERQVAQQLPAVGDAGRAGR